MPEDNTKNKFVEAKLYTRDYYLTDCDGYEDYVKGSLDLARHLRVIDFAGIRGIERVLDIGCGRGELAYQCALKGCKVLAIDYSNDAITLTKETVSRLPEGLRRNVTVEMTDITEMSPQEKFDAVFMVDVVEHLYDWQLEVLFKKVREILAPRGKLIIQTPNLNYDRFLFPLKKFFTLPFTVIKQVSRVLRGKRREKSWGEWLKKTFRIFPNKDRGEGLIQLMHINTQTPRHLKGLLSGFKTKIFCVDHSKNPVSLLFARWWGREMVVIAQ